MDISNFVAKWNGVYVEVAGTSAQNQCVDLANLYIRDFLGFPIIEWTNAKDFPSKGGSNYTWIANTPTGVPQEGDLVIWSGTWGHIAIFMNGNTNDFHSFDENYPTGTPCHIQYHTYANVLGWMRPKMPTPVTCDPHWRIERDDNHKLYLAEQTKVTAAAAQLKTCQDQVNSLKQTLNEIKVLAS